MPNLSHAQLAALIKRAQQGDSDAFTLLYMATIKRQMYFAATFLKDTTLAKDVTQEVYLSLYKNLGKLKNPKLLTAYLKQMTYHTCLNFQRSFKKQAEDVEIEEAAELPDAARAHNPDASYAAEESRNEVQAALSALPEEWRAAFLFRYYDEMKIHEIAAAMSVSERTVKRYLAAALAQLKQDEHLKGVEYR
jgi:RNA polymerase sigma-70 factor (ECF subfamily)